MRIVDIRHGVVPISRYADPSLPSGGLDTSIVSVVTDVAREGRPVIGYGFASMGRFAQDGLIRDRFAPRLLAAGESVADDDRSNLDPFRAWKAMMAGEKPGGHGERCVAVGTLDMAVWDAAAKIAGRPLYRFLSEAVGTTPAAAPDVQVYAGGGYYYPADDVARLSDEVRRLRDGGFERLKIKIGAQSLDRDRARIDAAAAPLSGPHCLAVDAMNSYDGEAALPAAAALADSGLWWFEDVCDPLDFDTLAKVAKIYRPPIAAGEALFSVREAMLLDRHGGLRRDRDILVFDPVHCYGLPGYLQIVERLEECGWPRAAFWPHGGHLFGLHVVRALGLGGAEVNPLCFQPFGGLPDGVVPANGRAAPPEVPGIGFETKAALHRLFLSLA
jgi:L-alanine-DL-glutamate epimerase-like enolase superfamily enzyme